LEDRREDLELVNETASSEVAGRWVDAGDLQVGDLLVSREAGLVSVDSIMVHEGELPTYNLHVGNVHTYTVGKLRVWVHNASKKKRKKNKQTGECEAAKAEGPRNPKISRLPLQGRIQTYGGALVATRMSRIQYAMRSKELYTPLTASEKEITVIAVSRVKVNGQWKEVVAVNGGAHPNAVKNLRSMIEKEGGIFHQAPGHEHPDTFIHQRYSTAEGFDAIGVSHAGGPCSNCERYFERMGFFDVAWDATFIP
jgi:hypothetical protein